MFWSYVGKVTCKNVELFSGRVDVQRVVQRFHRYGFLKQKHSDGTAGQPSGKAIVRCIESETNVPTLIILQARAGRGDRRGRVEACRGGDVRRRGEAARAGLCRGSRGYRIRGEGKRNRDTLAPRLVVRGDHVVFTVTGLCAARKKN